MPRAVTAARGVMFDIVALLLVLLSPPFLSVLAALPNLQKSSACAGMLGL
jgi:hypothetical protein